ncbi:MAG: DUF4258 domain-containing protein [Pseudomonadota bacterium]
MTITRHADQRMNQRGIPRSLVDFTLRHGRIDGDRHVLNRREADRVIESLKEELHLALRVRDKGGIAVVEGSGTVITTYNLAPGYRKPKRS